MLECLELGPQGQFSLQTNAGCTQQHVHVNNVRVCVCVCMDRREGGKEGRREGGREGGREGNRISLRERNSLLTVKREAAL